MYPYPIDQTQATSRHWRLIRHIRLNPVEPEEFKQKWGVTTNDLAKLLDLTSTHVSRWFFVPSASNYRPVEDKHRRRLAEIDYIWSTLEEHEQGLKNTPDHIRKHYEVLKKRR